MPIKLNKYPSVSGKGFKKFPKQTITHNGRRFILHMIGVPSQAQRVEPTLHKKGYFTRWIETSIIDDKGRSGLVIALYRSVEKFRPGEYIFDGQAGRLIKASAWKKKFMGGR